MAATVAAIATSKPKKKKGASSGHLSRSLAKLRDEGFTAEKVERPWNQFSKRRNDLYGLFDILAMKPGAGIVGIQVTDANALAEHRNKLAANPALALWIRSGGKAFIDSWSKRGAKGKRKLWTLVSHQAVLMVDQTVVWL